MHLFIWTVICGIFMTNVFATDLYTEADSGKITRYRPALIRTELKVSRSLDPSKTETINVKANNGGYASIIVKKRNGNTRNYYQPMNTAATKPSGSVRFEEPTDQKSVELINYFMHHFDQINTATSSQRQRQRHPSGIITAERSGVLTGDRNGVLTKDRNGIITSDRSFQDKPVYMSVPDPVVISSNPFYVKNSPTSVKRGRSLMKTTIDTDGIPIVEGIRVPDDEDDKKKVWRNARVIKGELVPYEKGYKPPKAEYMGKKIYAEIVPNTNLKEQQRFTRQSSGRSIGPFSTADNFPKEESVRGVGPFSIEDIKQGGSTRSGKGPFFVRDNARAKEAKFIDYIKQINEQQGRSNYFESRNLNSEPQMQRRMLQNNPYEDDESPRAPVFEYAHPDLGIQPATAVAGNNNEISQKSEKVQYYTNLGMIQQPQGELNTQEYYSNIPQSTYPYNFGYLKRVRQEPMWKKISDQVRSRFQSGITAVESLARPVIEPIMEAGNKISENLGFNNNNKNYAQDKVGLAAPAAAIASPSLLPALGLMAGGAALGIGALAVGRYFDENLLQRSDTDEYDPEHKRLLESSHRIYKRSIEDEDLQNIEVDFSKIKKTVEQTVREANWKDAECAKRMFCDIMVGKNDDEMSFMQKRIDGLLQR